MNIVITSEIIPQNILSNLPKIEESSAYGESVKGYSLMHPIASPMFPKAEDVVDWFNSLSTDKQMQFVSTDFFAIYVHIISSKNQLLGDYRAKEGEILSTDEAYVYERKDNKWVL